MEPLGDAGAEGARGTDDDEDLVGEIDHVDIVPGRSAQEAFLEGFQHFARVVAGAVIMMGVLAGFALEDDAIIKTIGFSLTVGVLADAFLVRMLIVPAFMLLVGDRIWWMPTWVDKNTPDSTSTRRSRASR